MYFLKWNKFKIKFQNFRHIYMLKRLNNGKGSATNHLENTMNLCKQLEYCIKEGIVEDAIKLVYNLANSKNNLRIRPLGINEQNTQGDLNKILVNFKFKTCEIYMNINTSKVSELKKKVNYCFKSKLFFQS